MSDIQCLNPNCHYMCNGEICTKCGKSQSYLRLESRNALLEKKVEKLKGVMKRVADQLDDHCSEEQTAPCGMRDELRAALEDGE
jgi:vacuolar-type H+-ATPase subunit E/Vma4